MKNQLSALIAALIFTSPLSYAAEKIKTNDIKEFSNVDIDRLSKIYFDNKKITQTDDNICNDFGHIDYDLWGVSNDAIDFYKIESEAKQKSIVENLKQIQMLEAIKQQKIAEAIMQRQIEEKNLEVKRLKQIEQLNKYDSNTDVVDFIDGFDSDIHKYLKRFTKNPTVKCFRDCFGREYNNMALLAVNSRFGNLGFGSNLSYSSNEFNQLRKISEKVTNIYVKYFPPKSPRPLGYKYIPLNDYECLLEKTRFIHFIEDIIIKPIYPDIGKITFDGYNRLLAAFNFFCNKGYQELVLGSWEDYLSGTEDSHLSKLLSDPKKRQEVMPKLRSFLYKSSIERKNHFSKNKNNEK